MEKLTSSIAAEWQEIKPIQDYGLFTLTDSDSYSDSDLDSKPYGYIVLCRNFSHLFGCGLGGVLVLPKLQVNPQKLGVQAPQGCARFAEIASEPTKTWSSGATECGV